VAFIEQAVYFVLEMTNGVSRHEGTGEIEHEDAAHRAFVDVHGTSSRSVKSGQNRSDFLTSTV
jgi:hypothetical protein